MNQNPDNEHLDPIKRPRFRFWSWKVAVLLAVILLVVCSYLNPRSMSYVCYYLDWRHWPRWYSANLWILALGADVNYVVQRKKTRYFIYACVLLVISVVTVLHSVWLHILIDKVSSPIRSFHYSVFRPYFYAPLTDLFYNGTVTGRLLIVPVSVLGLITVILFCRHAFHRNRDFKAEDPQKWK